MRERPAIPAFIVGREPGFEPEVRLGLKWLLETQAGNGEPLIVTPGKHQLTHGALAEVLGKAAVALNRVGTVRGPNGQTVYAATKLTFPPSAWRGGPVLALWPDAKTLEKLERHGTPSAICVVPWTFEEIATWASGRGAVDLTSPDTAPAAPVIGDPVVGVAMRELTLAVNLSTGLSHPSDREHAINVFRVLRGGRHFWDPAEIEAWALGNGWDLHGAEQSSGVARGVAEGKQFQTSGRSTVRSEALGRWRDDAARPTDA